MSDWANPALTGVVVALGFFLAQIALKAMDRKSGNGHHASVPYGSASASTEMAVMNERIGELGKSMDDVEFAQERLQQIVATEASKTRAEIRALRQEVAQLSKGGTQ